MQVCVQDSSSNDLSTSLSSLYVLLLGFSLSDPLSHSDSLRFFSQHSWFKNRPEQWYTYREFGLPVFWISGVPPRSTHKRPVRPTVQPRMISRLISRLFLEWSLDLLSPVEQWDKWIWIARFLDFRTAPAQYTHIWTYPLYFQHRSPSPSPTTWDAKCTTGSATNDDNLNNIFNVFTSKKNISINIFKKKNLVFTYLQFFFWKA